MREKRNIQSVLKEFEWMNMGGGRDASFAFVGGWVLLLEGGF